NARVELNPRGFQLERIVPERESAREGTIYFSVRALQLNSGVPEARSDSGTLFFKFILLIKDCI
ncbi:MAG: hypothetical protein ACPL6D_00590, partial [Thermodesulfobacteriota bacterium]